MKIKEIIKCLQNLDQEKEISFVWDGRPRSKIESIWVSRTGNIIAGELDEPVYDEKSRPEGAPTEKEDRYWKPEDSFHLISKGDEDAL